MFTENVADSRSYCQQNLVPSHRLSPTIAANLKTHLRRLKPSRERCRIYFVNRHMLIHLVLRFLTCPVFGPRVRLIDLRIDSVGLLLRDRVDLATRRSMPNKRMAIGCSKRSRMARVGLLIDTLRPARPFNVVYRWAVAAEQVVVHRVHYELLGEPCAYQVVSDKMATWPQRPTEHQHSIPTFVQPLL